MSLFSFVDLEDRVPLSHPLRKIREIVNDALATLDGELSKLYAPKGGPRSRPRSCSAPRCCRRSTRSVPSAS